MGRCAANNKTIYNSPAEVIITYSAVVTKDTRREKQPTQRLLVTTQLIIQQSLQHQVDPDKPTETTKVTITMFHLKKTNNAGETLTGAEFKLYDAQLVVLKSKLLKIEKELTV